MRRDRHDPFGARIVVVGATGTDESGPNSGSAYVFARNGTSWSLEAKLVPSPEFHPSYFGQSVFASGDSILVGCPGEDGAATNTGSAYVFVRAGTSWLEQARLFASDGAMSDYFGSLAALSGDTAVIGAGGDEDAGEHTGAAYVFLRDGTTWSERAKLVASDATAGSWFGSASLSGATAVIGAGRHDGVGADSGAAYVFEIPPPSGAAYCNCPVGPCGNSDPGAGCANSTGAGAVLSARGTTFPDEVNLFVAGARPRQPALFFQGDGAVMIPFGDGLRCAAGSVVRITVPPVQIEADGSVVFGPCFGDPTISSITGVVPGSGEIKRYQLWYRDPGGPCGSNFNLSNGYEITW